MSGNTPKRAPTRPSSSATGSGPLEQPTAVVFFGISGAGKGTQADLLARHLAHKDPERGVLRVDQGALLRARAARRDELGRRVRAIMAAGELVPDFVATSLLADYVSNHYSRSSHWIFDGVARYELQAQMFDELMVFYERPDYRIIVLELSTREARKRLALRGRSDEMREEQMQNRFLWWAEKTLPAIDLLQQKGKAVYRIDGSLPVTQVQSAILQRLGLA
jgi:adenylate kinase